MEHDFGLTENPDCLEGQKFGVAGTRPNERDRPEADA